VVVRRRDRLPCPEEEGERPSSKYSPKLFFLLPPDDFSPSSSSLPPPAPLVLVPFFGELAFLPEEAHVELDVEIGDILRLGVVVVEELLGERGENGGEQSGDVERGDGDSDRDRAVGDVVVLSTAISDSLSSCLGDAFDTWFTISLFAFFSEGNGFVLVVGVRSTSLRE
tara:strand:- start:67 stop:573 length:507 start_codon:yes stop_codon:yes gene_type:complete